MKIGVDTYLPIFVVYILLETIEMSLSCCCSVIKRQTEEDCYNFQFIGNTMLARVAGLTLADRPGLAGDPTPPSIVLTLDTSYCGRGEKARGRGQHYRDAQLVPTYSLVGIS